MRRPHDRVAKILLKRLVGRRRLITERELLPEPLRADIVVEPGPSLPPWTGVVGELIGRGLVVIEVFRKRPSMVELLAARAKLLLAVREHLLRSAKPGRSSVALDGRLLVITRGRSQRALEATLEKTRCEERMPGMSQYPDRHPIYIIDLRVLPLTPATALLHLLGHGERWGPALQVLTSVGEEAVNRMIGALLLEESDMQSEAPSDELDPKERREWTRIRRLARKLLTEEEIKAAVEKGLKQGIRKGRAEGRAEGSLHTLKILLETRFGPLPASVANRLKRIKAVPELEALLRRAAVASSLEEVFQSGDSTQ